MEIYLATAENVQHSRVLHALRYPYRLASYLSLDSGKDPAEVLEHAEDGSKWIMDSGLFSFMFGSGKGQLNTYEDFKAYAERYVEKMHRWKWKHTIVECDTQRLLGVEATQRLREEVFEKSGFEVMYVWHVPDGVEALATDYLKKGRIALSVPELRMLIAGDSKSGGQRVKRALIHLLGHCFGKGPAVHLLGNTETSLLSLRADSCDSSSWIYSVSYAKGTIYDAGRVRQISTYSPRWRAWLDWCAGFEPGLFSEDSCTRDRWLAASAMSYRLMIPNTHGDTPWTM